MPRFVSDGRAAGKPLPPAPAFLDLHPIRFPYLPGPLGWVALVAGIHTVSFLLTPDGRPVPFSLIAIPLGLLFVDWLWVRRRLGTPARLHLKERSLSVSTAKGVFHFPFDTLRSVALEQKPLTHNGIWLGMYRTLTLREGHKRATLRHLSDAFTEDEFGALVEVVMAAAVETALRLLHAGHSLSGDGWTLDAQGLKTPAFTLERARMAVSEDLPDKVMLFRRGETTPCLSIPLTSPNAYVLRGVLTSEPRVKASVPEGLGHRLAYRMTEIVTPLGCAFIGVAFAGLGLTVLVLEAQDLKGYFSGGFAILMGVPFLGLAMAHRPHILSIHERGLKLRRWPSSPPLMVLDHDVTELRLENVPNHYEGLYVTTTTTLTVVGAAGQRLVFKSERRHADAVLRAVHDRLIPSLTARLHRQLDAGHEVPWGEDALLGPEGLRLKRAPHSAPHAFYWLRFRWEDDVVHLSTSNTVRLLSLNSSATNFQSGLRVIQERAHADLLRIDPNEL